MIGYETQKPIRRTSRRRPAAAFWLLARNENRRMEVLMVSHGGGHTLPVFSGEGEAEMVDLVGISPARFLRRFATPAKGHPPMPCAEL